MHGLLRDRATLPDAVFAASDALALGALSAIQEAGLRVPDDIAVMGFDGLAESADAHPPLSTVTQPVAALGLEAVRIVLATIDDPDCAPVQRFLPTHLTLRRSCGCELPAGADEEGGVPEPVLSLASP
jgi:DNA-binding LacI/PurR family transcriptional regulator